MKSDSVSTCLTQEADVWRDRALNAESALVELKSRIEADIVSAEVRGAVWALEERAHLMTSSDRKAEAERICRMARAAAGELK
ncbi:MAG: hypothetical protein EBZ48_14870 [Proteobacteria bacterium]|nr:hypothetical protein [Pseudomonadota bacterium]